MRALTPDASAPASPSVTPPKNRWQANHSLETDTVGSISVVNMGHRLYLPEFGLFTAPDPKFKDTSNYGYAAADPINKSDPDGTTAGWVKTLITVGIALASVAAAVATLGASIPEEAAVVAAGEATVSVVGTTALAAGSLTFTGEALYTAISTGQITTSDWVHILSETALAASLAAGIAYAPIYTASVAAEEAATAEADAAAAEFNARFQTRAEIRAERMQKLWTRQTKGFGTSATRSMRRRRTGREFTGYWDISLDD